MESLIDSLDGEKWQPIDPSAKGDGYREFKVMRQHKEDPYGTFKYLIQQDDDDPKAVFVHDCKIGVDPLKDIGTCELKIDEDDGKTVLGVDLDGDIVTRK